MSFTVNRKSLLAELQLLQCIAEKKGTIPALSNVLCNLADGKLTLTASDMDVFIVSEIAAEGEAWVGCVPLSQLSAFARLAETDTVSLAEKAGHVEVKAGKPKCSLPLTPADAFPAVPLPAGDVKLTTQGEALRSALVRVLPCVMTEESRYIMQGVKFEAKAGALKLIATNSHRLGVATLDVEGEINTLIPQLGLQALLKTDSESVEIQTDENRASFRCGHRLIITRLLDRQFPNWELIMPKEMPFESQVSGEELLSALQRANITRSGTFKTGVGKILGSVTMIFQRELLTIDTGFSDRGRSEEPVMATSNLNGDSITVGVNPDYVMDFLRHAGQQVKCELKDAENILKFTDGSNFEYIVMPVRI